MGRHAAFGARDDERSCTCKGSDDLKEKNEKAAKLVEMGFNLSLSNAKKLHHARV